MCGPVTDGKKSKRKRAKFARDLVAAHDLKGKRVHDAHLLATMKANGIGRPLTFNIGDFNPNRLRSTT